MDLQSIDLCPYKYRIKSCIFKIQGRQDFIMDPTYVTEIYIEKDFENMAYPYFELTVTLPPSTYRDMRKNNTEVRCYIELQCAKASNDMSKEESVDELIFDTIIQDTFYVFLADNSPDMQSSVNDRYEEAMNLKKDQYDVGNSITTRLIIYNEEFLFRGKTIVNNVLKDVSILDGLVYVCSKAKLRKVLISPPDNTTIYNQIILPPLAASEQLMRLVSDYSMHEYGTTIFFDIDKIYILDNYNRCTVWEPNEIKKVYILSKQVTNGGSSLLTGSYEDPSRKYYVVNIESGKVNFSTGSMINDQTTGTNVISVDTRTGNINSAEAATRESKMGSTTQVVVNNVGEDKTSAFAHSIQNSTRIATCSLSNINIDLFKPNKEFIFSFDSAEFEDYMGSYHLTKLSINLKREGELLLSDATATFTGYKN